MNGNMSWMYKAEINFPKRKIVSNFGKFNFLVNTAVKFITDTNNSYRRYKQNYSNFFQGNVHNIFEVYIIWMDIYMSVGFMAAFSITCHVGKL